MLHLFHMMNIQSRELYFPDFENIPLTLNLLVAVVHTLNIKTHSSREIAEFSFENADVKSICYCKQRMEIKLSLSSECVETKLCRPCTSFTSHLNSSCGMVWYRTLRVKRCLTFRHLRTDFYGMMTDTTRFYILISV